MTNKRTTNYKPSVGPEIGDGRPRELVLVPSGPESACHFPAAGAPDHLCRRFVQSFCALLPREIYDWLANHDGALFYVTHYGDGVITAEASDVASEPAFTCPMQLVPGPGDTVVMLSQVDAKWEMPSMEHPVEDDLATFWYGIVAFRKTPGR